MCLRAAFRSKMPGLILTLAYGVETYEGKHDNALVLQILKEARRYRVKVSFVQLVCPEKELIRRVWGRSRRKFKKLSQPKVLIEILKKHPVRKQIPFVKNLVIDTSKTTPSRAADIIRRHHLP